MKILFQILIFIGILINFSFAEKVDPVKELNKKIINLEKKIGTSLKALSKINEHSVNGGSNYEILKNDDKFNVFKFTIKETTRLSPHKEYTYTGYRKELETPAVYKITTSDGKTKEIINKYKNIVEKFKDKTV